VQPELPVGRAVIAVGSLTLAPGTDLVTQPRGPQLLTVDSGQLDIVSEGSPAWIYDGAGSDLAIASLQAGGGAVLAKDAVVGLRNLGADPVTITLFAIVPGSALIGGAA
jgi:hypothetical protein